MNPPPADWPRISSSLYYEDASGAIDWLCRAFAFEVQLKVNGENGRVEHSELIFGGGLVMVGSLGGDKAHDFPYRRAPSQAGNINTQNMFVYVDDIEAHCKRARDAGATVVVEPKTTDYGEEYWSDRGYECVDVGGHHWFFAQRLRGAKKA